MASKRTPAEQEFINQKSRQLMVEMAEYAIKNGSISDLVQAHVDEAYLDHMKAKGWLTKRLPLTLTAGGWGVASTFLKR
mgnify:CR=1 FL=1